ncbi:MAG: lipopolysaccharide biosynthesis protein [Flavobacteriaceae bacterium]
MGIVIKQSLWNSVILVLGFGLGAINVLFLYTNFMSPDYFGLVTFILSTGNILLPLMSLGMNHSIVKFFSSYSSGQVQNRFLNWSLVLPLFVILPVTLLFSSFYEQISHWLSRENTIIETYTWTLIPLGILMGYFEVFFAWSKVQFKTVFGNFIKEVFARLGVFIGLFLVYWELMSVEQYIWYLVMIYGLRVLVMMVYAFYLKRPELKDWKLPENFKEVLRYSLYIITAGSAGTILLEIDKFMIPQLEGISQVAFYSVGVYMASVIAIPSRALQQIISPLTAKALNSDDHQMLEDLFKKSSLNLLAIGGLIFLLININVSDLYQIIGHEQYRVGIAVVWIISFSELFKLFMGNTNAVLTNSKYYRTYFYISLGMAISVVVLNRVLIESFGSVGAAISTMSVVVLFGIIKMLVLRTKMDLRVSIKRTVIVLILIALLYAAFSFVQLNWHPVINVIVKTVLCTMAYGFVLIKLELSKDVNSMLNSFFKK